MNNVDNSVITNVSQGPGSSAQVGRDHQTATATVSSADRSDSSDERGAPLWVKVLSAACIVAALLSFALGLAGNLKWEVGVPLVLAFVAVPSVLYLIEANRRS